jgi:hypothetical protein
MNEKWLVVRHKFMKKKSCKRSAVNLPKKSFISGGTSE